MWTLGSTGLRHIADIRPLSHSGTSRKKIACTGKIYEIGHAETSLWIFLNLFFVISFNKAGKFQRKATFLNKV